jgi:biopolymer transport protein ExbD
MKLPIKAVDKQVNFSIRMTPLIDIVFLLMIFFILTIQFIKPETVLENRLPTQQDNSITETNEDWETVRLRISFHKDGEELKMYLQERVVVSFDDLLSSLNMLPKKIMVVIEPEAEVPYKYVIGAYNACLKSEKSNIVFAISSS